jgi:hypothetical protein
MYKDDNKRDPSYSAFPRLAIGSNLSCDLFIIGAQFKRVVKS